MKKTPSAQEERVTSRPAALRFILSTGSLHTYGLDRCFELAAQAGFEGIEVMVDRRWDTRQPHYLQRLTARHRLPILALHVPLDNTMVPGWPDDAPGRIFQTVALAEAIGAPVVVHHLPPRFRLGWLSIHGTRLPVPFVGSNTYRNWLLEAYPKLQNASSVTLCIENLPAITLFRRRVNLAWWNTVREIARFPALTLDTTHLATWNLDPTTVYRQLAGQVRHVHLSNFNGRQHRRPEDGHLRLDRLLACLAADGYTGAVSLELCPEALNAGAPDDEIVRLLSASLAYCRAAAG
jgi:sugar phosphate isomerase/epimerase